jgi:hypothetical protein
MYTDEEWKTRMNKKAIPERPKWIRPIINDVPPLKGQMQIR